MSSRTDVSGETDTGRLALGIRAPLRHPKLTDQIIESLRQDIATGAYPRGHRLSNEREMAARFGVSQPTVREAIRVLEAMGLVEVRHGSGAYVTGNSADFVARSLETLLQLEHVGIIEALELRAVLARYSSTLIVRNATEDDLVIIEEAQRQLEVARKGTDYQEVTEAATTFHLACSAAAHSPLLFALESFLIRLVAAFLIDAWEREPEEYVEFWRRKSRAAYRRARRRFTTCLRARDEVGAQKAMSDYMDTQRAHLASLPSLRNLRLSELERVPALPGLPGPGSSRGKGSAEGRDTGAPGARAQR